MSQPQAQIDAARAVLIEPTVKPRMGGTLAAAALAASAAVLLAGVMILGPGVAIEDAPPSVSTSL